MCGRFALIADNEHIAAHFTNSLSMEMTVDEFVKEIEPRYNISPTQKSAVILQEEPNKIQALDWGFYLGTFPSIITNTRSETVAQKSYSKGALEHSRCIIPISGFYEWKNVSGEKLPYYFKIDNEEIYSLAGIYRKFRDKDGKEKLGFSIITTEGNELMSSIHNRMPVILSKANEKKWLSNDLTVQEALHMCIPHEIMHLTTYRVSKDVNNSRNESAGLIKEIKEGGNLLGY